MSSDSGRRGGREARRQLRAAPLEAALRPVRPGLEGGRYKPLSEAEIHTIHGAALDVLDYQWSVAAPFWSALSAKTTRAMRRTTLSSRIGVTTAAAPTMTPL